MKNQFFSVILLLSLLVALTGNAQAIPDTSPAQEALVYVNLASPDDWSRFRSTQLPVLALLGGGLLTGADPIELQTIRTAGLSFQVVDTNLGSGSYYWAEVRSSRPEPDYALYGQILLKTTHGVLLKMDPSRVDPLTQSGAELQAITLTPKSLPTAQAEGTFPDVVNPDPVIRGMIDQVTQEQVYQYDRELAGELPVWVDGIWYKIPTRHTNSGTPIQKTTNYVGRHLANDLGMNVDFQMWDDVTNPNVIGEITGKTNPGDIFIIGAHIDDVYGTPGADDNASGSVATLLAADILSQYQWDCTLRFAFWTGEEQGLYGSRAYAQRARSRNENIIGYLNLDMIAWNTPGSAPYINLIFNYGLPPTQELAQLYADVIAAYNLNLLPRFDISITGSDHASFWQSGYTSILAIEDNLGKDFNPYYHRAGDTPAHTDPTYFTNFVKASIATFAHMNGCLIPPGYLDGHITAASAGTLLEGAKVTITDPQGHSTQSITDSSRYYTHTLAADTYTVTASAYGYLPTTIDGVVITSNSVTTKDFALNLAPTHVVSGTVTESGTSSPLLAEIKFLGSPVTVYSDPTSGFYQATLPEGSYTMQVSSAYHFSQQRDLLLDRNQTQDFILELLSLMMMPLLIK